MLSWLNGKTRQKPEHITIEPIFDKDPPLYFLYPHAKLPGSSAPKVCLGKTVYIAIAIVSLMSLAVSLM